MKPCLRYNFHFFARRVSLCAATAVILLSPAGFGVMRSSGADESAVAAEEGAEVLTRGPVHEAFAETITFKATPGVMVPKAPPAAIEEIPPDQRPDGDNVTWIPGYWAWDDERDDFLWVSGIWRNLPPGRQWVPGYWEELGKEYQWTSGYWADAAVEEVEYLPEPPASIEAGPNIGAPSVDSVWLPGCWMWRQTRYQWRPGYWDDARPDWVWVPSYYVRSPRGSVFVDGYWDYDIPRRGVIFAPVYFRPNFYSRPGYRYSPSTVISLAAFGNHLFVSPRHRHYYFGDYYAPNYRRSFFSSHTYFSGGHGYDPIFAHNRWSHRNDARWERRVDEDFRYFRDNKDERPPRTLTAFQEFASRPEKHRRLDAGFATPLARLVASKDSTIKFKAVNEDERQKLVLHGREIRDFSEQRKALAKKTADIPDKGTPERVEPVRAKLPKSPIFSRIADKSAKADTPPPKKPEPVITEDKTGGKPAGKPGSKFRPGEKPTVNPDDQPSDQPGRGNKEKPGRNRGDQPKGEPKTTPDNKPNPDDQPSDRPGRGNKGKPGRSPGDQPKGEPKTTPENKPKELPGRNSEDRPGKKPKLEPADLPKQEPKSEPKEKSKREPKMEPKDLPKPGPKSDPREKTKREPKVEPKDLPKVEPRDVPKPKIEPREQPRKEPKLEPPKREPKIEPREQPKREPKVEPREQPKPSKEQPDPSKGRSKDNSDDKDKEKKDKEKKNKN